MWGGDGDGLENWICRDLNEELGEDPKWAWTEIMKRG